VAPKLRDEITVGPVDLAIDDEDTLIARLLAEVALLAGQLLVLQPFVELLFGLNS